MAGSSERPPDDRRSFRERSPGRFALVMTGAFVLLLLVFALPSYFIADHRGALDTWWQLAGAIGIIFAGLLLASIVAAIVRIRRFRRGLVVAANDGMRRLVASHPKAMIIPSLRPRGLNEALGRLEIPPADSRMIAIMADEAALSLWSLGARPKRLATFPAASVEAIAYRPWRNGAKVLLLTATVGRATVAPATVGRAPVGPAAVGPATVARASVGRAPAERAMVGRAPAGRATVGPAAVGPATVARATVELEPDGVELPLVIVPVTPTFSTAAGRSLVLDSFTAALRTGALIEFPDGLNPYLATEAEVAALRSAAPTPEPQTPEPRTPAAPAHVPPPPSADPTPPTLADPTPPPAADPTLGVPADPTSESSRDPTLA